MINYRIKSLFIPLILILFLSQNCSSNSKKSSKSQNKTIPVTIHLESECGPESLIIERNNKKECYQKKPFLTGDNINLISLTSGLVRKYDLIIEFDNKGTKILKETTSQNIDKKVVIIFNGDVITTPIIRMPIENGKIMISGAWENEEKVYNFVKKIEKDIEKKSRK